MGNVPRSGSGLNTVIVSGRYLTQDSTNTTSLQLIGTYTVDGELAASVPATWAPAGETGKTC
eukprot:2312087-Amphidinium_carterae.1